jgi:thioesterase domain-containing protein/acyl carrier protein
VTEPLTTNARLDPQVDACEAADHVLLDGVDALCPSETFLDKVKRTLPELCAEDAFPVPAWFSDQRSWVQDPCKSNSAVYNIPLAWRIRGGLDHKALRSALQEVHRRQPALRSVYRVLDDQLVEIVLPPRPIAVPVTDLTGLESVQAETRARQLAVKEASQPFDLAHEPGLRVRLVKFAPAEYLLVLVTHHLVCDDWSTGILHRDVFTLYQALVTGESAALPEVDLFSYGDFIRWHQKQLQGKGLGSRLAFWKKQLAGKSDFHHLQTDHPRPSRRSHRGAIEQETLPEPLTNSLKALSHQERVSLFMVMLAAFVCVLHRYSGHDDIALGSCAANRPRADIEALIGRFANDLLVRTSLSGNPTFRELLGRVRNGALTVYSYQDLPFAQLAEEIEPQSDPGRSPLFQVMFILQDAPKEKLQIPGLTLTWFPLDMGTAKYDLCVWLSVQDGLQVTLEYNSDLFEAATIRGVLDEYKKVLETMVNNPQGRISADPFANKRTPAGMQPAHVSQPELARRRDGLESQLVAIWESGFNKRPIDVHDDFFELGGDSLLAVKLFARIEKVFHLKIPLVTLVQAPTIEKLGKVILQSTESDIGGLLVAIQAGGSRPPLYCVHGQSGNLLIYRSLAQHLGADQPVYGLQPQGMDGKLPPLNRVEDMAARYIQEIQAIQPQGPYHLTGYCMGGNIALEMAQQLRKQGEMVGLLALLDSYNVGRMRPAFQDTVRFSLQKCWFGWKHLLLTDSRNKLTFLQRRLDELRNPPSDLSDSNEIAALSYVAKAYAGTILHVKPLRQYARYNDRRLGWEELAGGGLATFTLPIYPGQMFEEPFVRALAAKLRSSMDKTSAVSKQGNESPKPTPQ